MLDNLSDKEFENLFRKVSDSQEIEYNPEGWDAMRGVLLKEKRRRRLLWYFLGLAALLISSSTIFLFQNPSAIRSNASEGNAPFHDQVSIDQIVSDPIHSLEKTEAEGNSPGSPELLIEEKEPGLSGKIEPNHSTVSLSREFKFDTEKLSKTTPPSKSNNVSKQQATESQDIETLPRQYGLSSSQNLSSKFDTEINKKEDTKSGSEGIFKLDRLPTASFKIIAPLQTPNDISLPQTDQKPITHEGRKPGLGFELGLSREWTSTSLSYLNKGDIRIGIKVDFPISKKLAMGLGLEYYVDRYQISAGEYSPPEGFWTYDVAPLSTYARCAMIDIPIHLTFHFSGINNPGLFASIGATSINILEETYKYTYDKPNPHLIQEWSGRNTGRQIFNSIRLAGGYKFRLKKQWFATVSPYAQIPISGIGFGQVKLYTVGTTLSVRLQNMRK